MTKPIIIGAILGFIGLPLAYLVGLFLIVWMADFFSAQIAGSISSWAAWWSWLLIPLLAVIGLVVGPLAAVTLQNIRDFKHTARYNAEHPPV